MCLVRSGILEVAREELDKQLFGLAEKSIERVST